MPIIIINLVSVELLRKLIENVLNLFNWSYRVHSYKSPQKWMRAHTQKHTTHTQHTRTHIQFKELVMCWSLAGVHLV